MKTVAQCLLSDFGAQVPIGAEDSRPGEVDFEVVPTRVTPYEAPTVVVVGNMRELLAQCGCATEHDA